MLHAILHGKRSRLDIEQEAEASWRSIFRGNEDFLTATVFERLSYLEGPLLWSILRKTFGSRLPEYKVVDLNGIDFWPRWQDSLTSGTVEPDVFLKFSLGDPARRVDLVIEAKHGGLQYAHQWRRQWEAYHKGRKGEEIEAADDVYLLAIGGVGGSAHVLVERLTEEVHIASGLTTVVSAAAADWGHMANALFEAQASSASARFVINDLIEALSLFGYRHARTLDSLVEAPGVQNFASSLAAFAPLSWRP